MTVMHSCVDSALIFCKARVEELHQRIPRRAPEGGLRVEKALQAASMPVCALL